MHDNEKGLPEWRGTLMARHSWANDVTATLRANIYGDYDNCGGWQRALDGSEELTNCQSFDGKTLIDFDINWDVNESFSVTFGGNNVTDEGPDRDVITGEVCCGRIVRSDSVIDWQGPYYYVRGTLRWD